MKKKLKDHTLDEIVNLCESTNCRICPLCKITTVGEFTGLTCIFRVLSPNHFPTTLLESSIDFEEYKSRGNAYEI